MDKKHLNNEPGEQHLVRVRENYLKLKAEILGWQQKQGANLKSVVKLAENAPYLSLASLPEEYIVSLWQRLNEAAGAPQEDVELQNLLHKFKQGESLEDPLVARLQLALAGVAQLVCQQLVKEPGESNQPFGSCPVCGEKHFVTLLAPPVGKRYQKCLICSYQRPVNASGCASCGSEEAKKQTYLQTEEYPGVEVAVCSDCGSYFKQFDLRKLSVEDLLWEDIRTMPLNYAAENWLAGQKGWS